MDGLACHVTLAISTFVALTLGGCAMPCDYGPPHWAVGHLPGLFTPAEKASESENLKRTWKPMIPSGPELKEWDVLARLRPQDYRLLELGAVHVHQEMSWDPHAKTVTASVEPDHPFDRTAAAAFLRDLGAATDEADRLASRLQQLRNEPNYPPAPFVKYGPVEFEAPDWRSWARKTLSEPLHVEEPNGPGIVTGKTSERFIVALLAMVMIEVREPQAELRVDVRDRYRLQIEDPPSRSTQDALAQALARAGISSAPTPSRFNETRDCPYNI